jgi:hypothetical protein
MAFFAKSLGSILEQYENEAPNPEPVAEPKPRLQPDANCKRCSGKGEYDEVSEDQLSIRVIRCECLTEVSA